MRNFLLSLGVLLASTAWSARASADQLVFTTVDDVSRYRNTDAYLVITGIASGDAAPRKVSLQFDGNAIGVAGALAASCERYALLVMSKPGRFLLELTAPGAFAGGDSFTYFNSGTCRLKRAP